MITAVAGSLVPMAESLRPLGLMYDLWRELFAGEQPVPYDVLVGLLILLSKYGYESIFLSLCLSGHLCPLVIIFGEVLIFHAPLFACE